MELCSEPARQAQRHWSSSDRCRTGSGDILHILHKEILTSAGECLDLRRLVSVVLVSWQQSRVSISVLYDIYLILDE